MCSYCTFSFYANYQQQCYSWLHSNYNRWDIDSYSLVTWESDARANVWWFFVGVYLALRSHFITNNSHVNIRSIGRHSNRALQCITDKSPSGCRHGEWFFPNGDRITEYPHGSSFYRRGGNMYNRVISLYRPHNVMTPTGQFCCKVLDATFILQTHCVIIGKKSMAY